MEMPNATILSSRLPRVERKARIRVWCAQPLFRQRVRSAQEFGRLLRRAGAADLESPAPIVEKLVSRLHSVLHSVERELR
jgi:hypothetical protein